MCQFFVNLQNIVYTLSELLYNSCTVFCVGDFMKRVFVIVLDSLGIGELPDAAKYNDSGSNTLRSLYNSEKLNIPNLCSLGLFNIEGNDYFMADINHKSIVSRMAEKSNGKDTTVGHWEIMGLVSEKTFPTYPNGFPDEIINEFERKTGKKVLCNKPYSGTQVILDYGKQHEETGELIVYTSSDSVFQIAAHESVVPIKKLYKYCEIARNMLVGEHAVGRVIARPFVGEYPNYTRTANRHDFSVTPPNKTALDFLKDSGFDVIAIGKINDIFAGKGITKAIPTVSNDDGMSKTLKLCEEEFNGLCFVNLVEFDSLYGHRNNTEGYTNALNEFDAWLGIFLSKLKTDDILIITADHGCDPETESTDHSREYTPMLLYRNNIKPVNLGTRDSFADIGKTVLDIFDIQNDIDGVSFAEAIKKVDNE